MKNESFTFSPILQWTQKELFVISYQGYFEIYHFTKIKLDLR